MTTLAEKKMSPFTHNSPKGVRSIMEAHSDSEEASPLFPSPARKKRAPAVNLDLAAKCFARSAVLHHTGDEQQRSEVLRTRNFGRYLQEYRLTRGLSLQEAAKEVNLNENQYFQLERGFVAASEVSGLFPQLAAGLDIPLDKLARIWDRLESATDYLTEEELNHRLTRLISTEEDEDPSN